MVPREPGNELVALDDPEVDWTALMLEVREIAKRGRTSAPSSGSDPDAMHDGAAPVMRAGPSLSPAHGSALIRPYPGDTEPARRWRTVHRVVRRALRWFLWPVTSAMSEHNIAVSAAMAEHSRHIALLGAMSERLRSDADRLERRSRS